MAFLKVLGSANRQISHWKVNTYAYENLAFIPMSFQKVICTSLPRIYFQCRIKKKRIPSDDWDKTVGLTG